MEKLRNRIIVSLLGLLGLSPLALGCFGVGTPPLAPSAEDHDMVLPGLSRSLPAAPGGAVTLPVVEQISQRWARRQLKVFGSQLCIDLAGKALAGRFLSDQRELELVFEHRRERDAIEQVIGGNADLALVSVALSDFERSYGVDELVFAYLLPTLVAHRDNPIGNLLPEQIRPLLSGKLSSWHDLGGSIGDLHGFLAGPEFGAEVEVI